MANIAVMDPIENRIAILISNAFQAFYSVPNTRNDLRRHERLGRPFLGAHMIVVLDTNYL